MNELLTPSPAELSEFDKAETVAGLTPQEERAMESFLLDPAATNAIREEDGMPPIEQAAFDRWLFSLSLERLQELEEESQAYREMQASYDASHEKLTALLPELYGAGLPQSLEEKMNGRQYAIGFNQTLAETIEEAEAILKRDDGVDTTDYTLADRFLMYDKAMEGQLGSDNSTGIARAIESGYYGDVATGRFVAVFPEEHKSDATESLTASINIDPEHILPEDALVRRDDGRESYSSKYVAGFIDKNGDFWINENFTRDGAPLFVPYERPVPRVDEEDIL